MRHGRHHAALHQAQLAGPATSRTCRASCMRRFTSRTTRPSGSGAWSTSRRTCSSRPAPTRTAATSDAQASYQSARQGRRRGDPQGRCRADRQAPSGRSSTPAAASINSGPEAVQLLRELVELTGFPITSTLMGLGAYPASGQAAGSACSACTAPTRPTWRCTIATSWSASARASTTASPGASTPSRRARRRSTSTSIPSSINKNVRVDVPIIGDVGHVLEDMLRVWRAKAAGPTRSAHKAWWARDRHVARAQLARLPKPSDDVIMPQYAVQRLYRGRREGPRHLHHHRGRPASDVGGAASIFEEPNRWMTSGGLGTMGYGLPAAIGVQVAHPRRAGHRHRRRRVGADDHAGDVDGGAVRPADQDLHPEQPVHGHGAAVAAAAARQPPVAFYTGGAAGFRQAGGSLWRRRHPLRRSPASSTAPSRR